MLSVYREPGDEATCSNQNMQHSEDLEVNSRGSHQALSRVMLVNESDKKHCKIGSHSSS